MGQVIMEGAGCTDRLEGIIRRVGGRRPLIVCDGSYPHLNIREKIDSLQFERVYFSGFTSNPLYEDVCAGVELFRREGCDVIIAVGGGSAMDVAKCIRLFAPMDPSSSYLDQEFRDSGIPLVAVPTTAGTGSESTRYAVVYKGGVKQSVTHGSIIPGWVVLDPSVLGTLPPYQKKCTMMDALCQGIESWWSIHSTAESRELSRGSVSLILEHMDGYLKGDPSDAGAVMHAANLAGRAINTAQTTAPHAMSYKLTSMYGIPHGHAVALCMGGVWRHMLTHTDQCVDRRGRKHLEHMLDEIGEVVSPAMFSGIMERLQLDRIMAGVHEGDIGVLVNSVNPVRLKNSPVPLDREAIEGIYREILFRRDGIEKAS